MPSIHWLTEGRNKVSGLSTAGSAYQSGRGKPEEKPVSVS